MISLYLVNLLLALDEAVNTLLLGDPADSISGRLGRAMASGKPKWFVPPIAAFVDWAAMRIAGQKDHCISSITDEDLNREIWSFRSYKLWLWWWRWRKLKRFCRWWRRFWSLR